MNKGIYIAVVVALFLSCLIAGMSWLTTKQDLETTRVITQQLTAENEQYASALKEANYQVETANEQIRLANNQNLLADTRIKDLEKKLGEAERYGSFWWERAHPREFRSLDELKSWLAQDDTDSVLYIFGSGCLADYDCDDYAVALVYNALQDGYSISTELVGDHMINSTIIGNEIYLIEPQTDEVKFWGYRD